MTKIKYESDIRGAGNLTIDAITGITDLVEAMHRQQPFFLWRFLYVPRNYRLGRSHASSTTPELKTQGLARQLVSPVD